MIPPRWRPHPLPSQLASAGLAHQPLSGLLFPPRPCWARWPLCARSGPGFVENARPAWRPHPLPAPQAHLRLSGVKPRMPRRPPSSGTSTRTRPSWTCKPGALPAQPPPPSLPGEPRPRWAAETRQEDGRPPDRPPQAGWSLQKAYPQAPPGAAWAQPAWRSPSGIRASAWSVKGNTDRNRPPWPGTIETICVSYFMTGGSVKEQGTNKPPPTGRIWKRSKGDATRPTSLPQFSSLASILAERCTSHQEGPWVRYWPETTQN